MSSNKENLSPTGATSRVNIATFFDTSKTIVNVTPTGQWVITPNQPASAPKVTPNPLPDDSAFTIEFDAGRKGSSDVAQQFINLCGSGDNMFGIGAGFSSTPGELNFFFGLTLQLQGSLAPIPVYLGQGSVIDNNWWIGSGNIKSGLLEFISGGNLAALSISGDGSNNFIFNAH